MTDFAGFLRAPSRARVDFIIVGGFAGTLHGSTLPTRDLDIVYSRDPGDIERLVTALAAGRARDLQVVAELQVLMEVRAKQK